MPKILKNTNSIKELETCNNQLLRDFTKMGPNINFSAVSSANKLNNYKILGIGIGLTLKEIMNRKNSKIMMQNKLLFKKIRINENSKGMFNN